MSEPETVFFEGPEAFEAWLEANGATSDGIWVRMAKKSTGVASLDWTRGVEVALCFGWIDGQRKGLNGTHYLQKFTPRRARSKWSQINVGRAEALIASGRMQPPGLAEVERAKADGRWEAAYDPPSTAEVPDDLRAALDAEPAAAEAFAGLGAQSRYVVLHRLMTAKRADTRERRIAQFVAMLARGERP